MAYVIVDTSSIIFGLSNKVDVFAAIKEKNPLSEPLISMGVLDELNRIRDSKGKFSKFAAAGIYLIAQHEPDIANVRANVDDWIVEEARKLGCDVCTNDVALKKRLKALGVRAFSVSRSGSLR